MKKLLLAVIVGLSMSALAENANFDTNTFIANIPLLDINGVTALKNVKLKYRSDGLLEVIGSEPYNQAPVNTGSKGKWYVTEEVNPVNDSKKVILMLFSDSGKSRYGNSYNLIIRCNSGVTDFFINWDTYLGNKNQNVTSRLESDPSAMFVWYISTDGTSTFFPGSATGFITGMFNKTKFVAETNSYSSGIQTGVWDITGIENAIVPLRQACNW